MTGSDPLPLKALVALIGALLLALSVAFYAVLTRVVPRVAAALVAPLLAMLAGGAYAGIALVNLPPDAEALHLLVLMPPFVFGIGLPVGAALLLWVFATGRRA